MMLPKTPRSRAGFTLLELMAVILIIGILAVALIPNITSAFGRSKVAACQANLREINKGMLEYQMQYERLPNGYSGVAFFASLVSRKVWPAERQTTKRFICPAVDVTFHTPGANDIPLDEWFVDLEQLDGSWSSYAGRNTREYPLRKYPGSEKEAIVADDNDGAMNHETTTNVLWGNGTVFALELQDLIDDGTVSNPEETLLEVGPGSPVEALRKLSLESYAR